MPIVSLISNLILAAFSALLASFFWNHCRRAESETTFSLSIVVAVIATVACVAFLASVAALILGRGTL